MNSYYYPPKNIFRWYFPIIILLIVASVIILGKFKALTEGNQDETRNLAYLP